MRNIRGYLAPHFAQLLAFILFFGTLISSCRSPTPVNREVRVTVVLDKTQVKLGDEIHVIPDRHLTDWSGEATVNTTSSRLPIDSRNNAIRVTNENGFVLVPGNDVCVTLKDRTGRNIELLNGCSHVNVTAPTFTLTPSSDTVNANPSSGKISLKAPADQEFKIEGAPDWVKLKSEAGYESDSVIRYSVEENRSYKARSANILIGDARFELTQWGSPYIDIPFSSDFAKPPIPTWEMVAGEFKLAKSHDVPPVWILDNQPHEEATVHPSSEGPSGKAAFVVERNPPPADSWKSIIWLPGIRTQQGVNYKASLWLKAENPVLIGLEFGQRTAPYANCGGGFQFFYATPVWKPFALRLKSTHTGCGPDNNRISIHVGAVVGKLWIADFSLAKE